MLSVLEHGQLPAPAGEFAGDRGVGDGDAFVAFVERLPARVQASVTRVAPGPCRRTGLIPAAPQRDTGPIRGAVVPGRFNEQPADVPVAGLGDRPLRARSGRGRLAGH